VSGLDLLLNNGVLWGGLGVVAFFVFLGILKIFMKVTSPNKIFVVTGRSRVKQGRKFGFSVERGRTTVLPYFQQLGYLDLDVTPINVRVEGVNSANGITVGADATACVCIDDENEAMLYSAVERLMGKSREQIKEQIQQTLVGNFRGALNKATPLQAIGMEDAPETSGTSPSGEKAVVQTGEIVAKVGEVEGERAQFRNELLKDSNSDLANFGMKVVSVSLQKIWDTSNYIANLAQKTLAQKRKQVEIEEARLRALAEQAESDGERRRSVAKSQADERIIAAQQKLEVYRQESEAQIKRAALEADNTVLEAKSRGERAVQELAVELKKLENLSSVVLEEDAKKQAAEILAAGENEAVNTIERAKNTILEQKMKLLTESGDLGKTILFLKQQLPHLFAAYREYAQKLSIDSLVIMDRERGIDGALNRGPEAFADFLKRFESALGISVKDIITQDKEVKS
jgi:flotillin